MLNIDLAKLDPASVFKRPSDVLRVSGLSRAEKIAILKSWSYDEREKSVAEEENMGSTTNADESNLLDEILKSLLELGCEIDDKNNPPTKQGG